jgi:hypothetical protein
MTERTHPESRRYARPGCVLLAASAVTPAAPSTSSPVTLTGLTRMNVPPAGVAVTVSGL